MSEKGKKAEAIAAYTGIRPGVMRLAGLARAWAIVRPMAGKEGILKYVIEGNHWEMYRPILLHKRLTRRYTPVLTARPMMPGYIFVRPPVGERAALRELPYVVNVMGMVVFDSVVQSIAAYEAGDADAMGAQVTGRVRKAPIRDLTVKSFADLAEALGALSEVDEKNICESQLQTLCENIIERTIGHAATLDAYIGTDEFATTQRASVRKQWYFRKN